MRLKRITATNFKGLTFEYDLTKPINIITGDNFVGKTARIDLIRWVLLGYLPELGATNRATFKLASGREMLGTAEFDNGMVIHRRLALKGDTVKETAVIPDGLKDHPLLGVMLNAEAYFGLTPRERINYVFSNCPQDGNDLALEAIRGRLTKDLQPDDTTKAIIDRVLSSPGPISENPAGKLDAMVEAAASEASSAREYATRMEKTAQGLAGLKAADTAAPAGPIENPEALAKLSGETQARYQELQRFGLENQARARRRMELQGATSDLQDTKKDLQLIREFLGDLPTPLTDLDNKRYGITAKIATLEARSAAHASNKARIQQLTQELAILPAIEAQLAETEKQLEEPCPTGPIPGSAQLQVEQAQLQGQLNEAETAIRQTREAWKKINTALGELGQKTTCPYCGATGISWKTIKRSELTRELDQITADGQEQAKARESILRHLETKAAAITSTKDFEARAAQRIGAHKALERSAASLRAQISGLQAKKQELTRLEADHGLLDFAGQTIPKLKEEATALEDQIAKIRRASAKEQELTGKISRMEAQKAELDQMPSLADPGQWAIEMGQLEAKSAEMTAKMAQIRSQMAQQAQRQADLQRLAQAEKARDTAKAEQAFAVKLAETLRTIQAESVARAFGPMLAIANSFASPVLKTPLAYNPDQEEIGTYRGGLWIGHRTMSGTEKAIVYAAIQAALASRSPVKLMIIDELGRIGDKPLWNLMASISQGINAGLIDGFIGIDAGRAAFYHKNAQDFDCQVTELRGA